MSWQRKSELAAIMDANDGRIPRSQWPKAARDEKPSSRWTPMRFVERSEFGEEWCNDQYQATKVEMVPSRMTIGNESIPLVPLGITAINQTSRHDWRDFQRVKNDIMGDEWEAVELYPAESRLIDPSNRFYLWCYPKGTLRFGLPGQRCVLGPSESGAPQRAFHGGQDDWRIKDSA